MAAVGGEEALADGDVLLSDVTMIGARAELSGNAVTLNQVITVAQITAGSARWLEWARAQTGGLGRRERLSSRLRRWAAARPAKPGMDWTSPSARRQGRAKAAQRPPGRGSSCGWAIRESVAISMH